MAINVPPADLARVKLRAHGRITLENLTCGEAVHVEALAQTGDQHPGYRVTLRDGRSARVRGHDAEVLLTAVGRAMIAHSEAAA